MKHFFIVFTILALAASVSFAQMDRSPSQSPESFTPAMNPNAVYDLQFDYDAAAVTGANGNAGAIFFDNAAAGGPQFWTSRWSVPAGQFNSWNPNGTLRATFTIPGVTGVRGMTYDGTYIYASSGAASIFQIDPVAKTLVSTITCQGGVTTRMLTYDPVRDGFWTAAFAGNISCVNRSGAVIATIPNTMVAKYGSAYDSWSPGGPYLWVFDQTNTAGGTPQNIYKLSLTTLTGARLDSFNVLLRVTTGGAVPIAGGLFTTTGLVPSKVTIGGLLQGVPDRLFGLELTTSAADTVLPFTLQSPAAGVKLTTLPGSTTPVVISWDTNRVGVTFKWIFGNPTVPPRRFTLPSATNTLTTTLGALDAMLAAGGVAQGDSLIGQWDVWAFRNNAPANDSLKASNGPRSITLKRGRPTLSAFGLVSPPSGTTIVTSSIVTTPISFVWNKSGDGVTFRWKFATPTFPGTIRFNVSTVADTFATFPSFRLDSLVASLGVNQGDSIVGQWRAYAYSGTDSLASTQAFNVTFRRDTPPLTEPHHYNLNTGTSSNSFPFATAAGKAVNSIFLAGEFNQPTPLPAGKAITRVFFRTSVAGTRTFTNLHILMAQDTITTLTTGTFYPGPYDTVYVGSPTLTCTVDGWMGITLDHPFNYNPTKSLITFVGHCGNTGTGMNVRNSTLTPVRRTWSIGGCPFAPFATGGDGAIINFGVGVVPATSVPEPVDEIPTQFKLSQNYPNPFNPSTMIQFGLPVAAEVTLKIYNVLGQEVITLFDGQRGAGTFQTVWNGQNSAGNQMASGMYFYNLVAKSADGKSTFTNIKKMLLLK